MTPAETFAHSIDSRLTPGATKELFGPDGKRSPACWARTIDLSCVSPWNSHGGALLAAVAISPLHWLANQHYATSAGATHRYVSMAGEVVECAVANQVRVIGDDVYPGLGPDLVVGSYAEPLPPSIVPARILPVDWRAYIPNAGYGLPTLCLAQEEKALVQNVATLDGLLVAAMPPGEPNRQRFYESKIGGDSSNPMFLVWNATPILICTLLMGGAGAGPSTSYYSVGINAAMRELGGGFQLQALDFGAGVRPPVRRPGRKPSVP